MAAFDAGRLSSNGGLVMLPEIADRLGLARAICGPVRDERDQARIVHSYADMVTARMAMIAAGYEDCDDIDTLKTDPALKIACGRPPETGADLMSQPTLSRLENAPDWREHCAMRRSRWMPTVRRFHQLPYRTREWSRSRKVIARAEATSLGTDARFIVTNLDGRRKTLYHCVFCARGKAENLIEDMKLHALPQDGVLALAGEPAPTVPASRRVPAPASPARCDAETLSLARCHFETIRRAFVEIAVRVEELRGRIQLAFPASCTQAVMLAVMTGAITKGGP